MKIVTSRKASIMYSQKSSSSSGESLFLSGLTITFIVLKLLGKIDWSWWWVLSPIWIPLALISLLLLVVLVIALVKE